MTAMRRLRIAATFAAYIITAGCASLMASSWQQRLYAAHLDYVAALEVAVAYKEDCDRRANPPPCPVVVAELRRLQGEARKGLDAADAAVAGGEGSAAAAALLAVRSAISALRSEVAR